MAVGQIELLNPVAKVSVKDRPTAKVLDTLSGKVVGFFESYKDWRGFTLFAKRLEELLPERHGVRDFVWHKASAASGIGYSDPNLAQIEKDEFDKFAREVDCAIFGGAF